MRKVRIVVSFAIAFMILTGIAALPASAQNTMDASCIGEYNAVNNGCTVPAGTIALTEVVDRANGTITIFHGELEQDFAVSEDHNAWVINDIDKAAADAISHADVRYTDPAFAGYTILVNNEDFVSGEAASATSGGASGLDALTLEPGVYTAEELVDAVECRPAMSSANANVSGTGSGGSIYGDSVSTDLPVMSEASASGLAVPAGTCINSGLIVVRVVQYGVDGWEDVRALEVGNGLVVLCGKHGNTAYDCWENYPGSGAALYAACEQARGDIETIDTPGAFNHRFSAVLYNGGPVPSVCS